MKKIILAVDVGNTSITCGIFKGGRLAKRFEIPTDTKRQRLYAVLKMGLSSYCVESAIVSSVVPVMSKTVIGILTRRLRLKTLLLGKDIRVPIKNRYRKPLQVGQDRLVNAYACLKLYGTPAVVVDFGTATTFDYVDAKGAYAGGLITPGVAISLDALASRTALLPRIELKKPKDLIGRDTTDSMRSGILYGLSSLCDGIIKRLKKRYGSHLKVVATGGLSSLFKPYCSSLRLLDKDLTLKGLSLISDTAKK